ncbi:unnamed protein product [Orchesella dallaii]|uniref:Uncharacterized protein n=1 Tax=Orchesella dallaii TaxID=48710 RepID=A0ABP1QMA3_9HEXA
MYPTECNNSREVRRVRLYMFHGALLWALMILSGSHLHCSLCPEGDTSESCTTTLLGNRNSWHLCSSWRKKRRKVRRLTTKFRRTRKGLRRIEDERHSELSRYSTSSTSRKNHVREALLELMILTMATVSSFYLQEEKTIHEYKQSRVENRRNFDG